MAWLIQASCEAVLDASQGPGDRPGRQRVLEALARIASILDQTNRTLRSFLPETGEPTVLPEAADPPPSNPRADHSLVQASLIDGAERLVATIEQADHAVADGAADGPAVAEVAWLGLHEAHHLLGDAELALLSLPPGHHTTTPESRGLHRYEVDETETTIDST